MKYKVTFPSITKNPNRLANIRCLRTLIPGLGLKEASDLTRKTESMLLTLGYYGQEPQEFFAAINELTASGVKIQEADEITASSFEQNSSSTPSTINEISRLVKLTIDREEYEIAEELMSLLRRYKNPVFISEKAA